MKNPCFNPSTGEDCSRRKPGCGAHCKEWAKYIRKRDQVYKNRSDDVETDSYIVSSSSRRNRHYRKK